jgi:uncharacterized protein YjbI with pentapeptide repeats
LPYPPDLDDDHESPTALAAAKDVLIRDVDWANERALGLELRRVELRLCRLTGADLAEAVLTDVSFLDCRLDLVSLRHARLERVVLRDCRLEECDFHGASLRDVTYERCILRGASFAGAHVERVDLVGCDLLGASGVERLRGARIPWDDVVANAPVFAAALGLEIVD